MRDLAAESEGPAREDEPVRKGRFGLAIEALAADYQLSPRETDVLRCLAMGYNSSTTASKLSISLEHGAHPYAQRLRQAGRSFPAGVDCHGG